METWLWGWFHDRPGKRTDLVRPPASAGCPASRENSNWFSVFRNPCCNAQSSGRIGPGVLVDFGRKTSRFTRKTPHAMTFFAITLMIHQAKKNAQVQYDGR